MLNRMHSLDWREFHFFKNSEGLPKSDLVEVRMCLDYERARESQKVIDDVALIRSVAKSSGYFPRTRLGRFVPVPIQDEADLAEVLPVPAVCVEADWFPTAWLCGSGTKRRKIVKKYAAMYETPPLYVTDFPLKFAESRLLKQASKADKTVTLHVIAVNRAQPPTAILEQFGSWLWRQRGLT